MKSLGQHAYEGYFESCGGRSINGEPLPDWVDQKPSVQHHWDMAAERVRQVLEEVR